ncbi:MAG: glycosyltransferase family 9 protein [Candidatus Kapabacteria bacterium]|nr:glycosyltransferase family 9 protein [Candidatus Kapabacteria bacterium]MDW8012893.1 glycosyltransferase family 9 protein [Bacteroidota bacterium]
MTKGPLTMRMLVFALSGIGDALMFTPALRLFRQHFLEAEVDVVAMFTGVRELYERNPDTNRVYFWDFLQEPLWRSLGFLRKLRQQRYDIALSVYPSNRWEYNLLTWLTGAPIRVGHTYNHQNFRQLNWLKNRTVREDDRLHNVEENVRLVQLLGVPIPPELPSLQLFFWEQDLRAAEEWLQREGIPEAAYCVGFHAGSAVFKNHVRRRWAPERFAALATRLIREWDAWVLLFGAGDEVQLNEYIRAYVEVPDRCRVVRSPSLMVSAAIMRRCRMFVSNDSALMHVAAALRLPTVAIFAYTNPAYVRPWKTQHILVRRDLPCSPCFYYSPRPAQCHWKGEEAFKCIREITVQEVWSACQELRSSTETVSSVGSFTELRGGAA